MVVKTDKGCFISDCFAASGYNYNYHNSKIPNLFFNGKKAIETYCANWYFIEEFPTLIQQEKIGEIINRRYELDDKSLESDKMPAVIPYDEKDNYNDDVIENLYSLEYEREPKYIEDFPCELQIVCEIEGYTFPPKINYAGCQYIVSNADVQHQMLDKIIFPAVLLHERPSKFTSKQMYDITRQYIINNIDNSVAKITSNYNFCFEVKKLIPLIEPETISFQNFFARTKKERSKIRTTVKKFNEISIFYMTSANEAYRGYPIIPEMCANSEKVDIDLLSLQA